MSRQIQISPIFDPWYYEFYIKGLFDYYGKENVTFSFSEEFLSLKEFTQTAFRKDFLYYHILDQDKVTRVAIAADDKIDINQALYDRVDIYAKVNVTQNMLPLYSKLFPIGPNFGIRFFSIPGYLLFSAKLFLKSGIKNPYLRAFFKLSIKRQFLPFYTTVSRKERKGYIFYINYPWKKHTDVTENRKKIITILKKMADQKAIEFEGGFSIRRRGPFPGFESLSASKKYSIQDYLQKITESSIAINTPAVHNCLGWKIGEYLALGKPIISTPLNRVLPGTFEKGNHYIEIQDIGSDLENAILRLTNADTERKNLSKNALSYFNNYLKPEAVIRRIDESVNSLSFSTQ